MVRTVWATLSNGQADGVERQAVQASSRLASKQTASGVWPSSPSWGRSAFHRDAKLIMLARPSTSCRPRRWPRGTISSSRKRVPPARVSQLKARRLLAKPRLRLASRYYGHASAGSLCSPSEPDQYFHRGSLLAWAKRRRGWVLRVLPQRQASLGRQRILGSRRL